MGLTLMRNERLWTMWKGRITPTARIITSNVQCVCTICTICNMQLRAILKRLHHPNSARVQQRTTEIISHICQLFPALSNATDARLNPFQTSDLKKPMMNDKCKSNYCASVQFFILIKYNQQWKCPSIDSEQLTWQSGYINISPHQP